MLLMKVAIKKVPHSNPKEKLSNYNEIRYLRMCDSPNIVKIGLCYEFKDECWMAMEYMEGIYSLYCDHSDDIDFSLGGTLTEARRGHEFAEPEIAYVAREVLIHYNNFTSLY
jgi:serine/threonine protein kinase